ncbi:MAG: hypothetical protein K2K24_00170, partial [Clostridia bacterium]|nr:hypothetical protein [Clostridia bacterium]
TQTTYFIDPFDYFLRISNGETAEDIYPSEANVLFTNGTVRKMPIQWIGLEKFAIYDYSSKVAQLQVRIGFDATAEGNLSSMIKGNLVQTTYVNVKVENLTPVGFDVAGSEYSKNNNGEEVFYIDPIQYLYYGVDPFPSIVTMVYESEIYENGKTTDLHVTWDFDRSLITMYGGKYQALIKVSDDLDPYVIDVEVLDRSNLQVAVDYVEVDPYKYKTAEDGSRIYSSFSSTSYIYQQIGVIDYTDRNDIKVSVVNTASGNVSDEFDTYVQYEVTYINGNNVQTVYRNKSLDMIADFFAREGASAEIISAVVRQYYNVNVEWDLTEINYAMSDVYKVKMTAKALKQENDKTFNVNVNVMAKEVEYVDSENYCVTIMVDATNLSEEERITKTMMRNLRVMFTDGTTGVYECTIDLSTVDFERYDVQYVDGQYVDKGGNVVEDINNLGDLGVDINITVCSGDIAQVKTAKAVVVYEAE